MEKNPVLIGGNTVEYFQHQGHVEVVVALVEVMVLAFSKATHSVTFKASKEPGIDILEPAIIMEVPTSSTNGKKRKNPYESINKESDEIQETRNGALATEQSLKNTKKSQYPTILVFYYRKNKKICSNQMDNDQSRENSTDPIQEEEDKDLRP
ncbi:hypothetical protein P7K49_039164 [Saguinus oedipus]|uniref:Uncharacterized protein n=1 Tax=Saguinus oedipus TaxID=9490 RepID=A0ABQ9TGP5_SAGOE|nr:hypothetical protein P7K49_039164 [Saguinus oedipus]